NSFVTPWQDTAARLRRLDSALRVLDPGAMRLAFWTAVIIGVSRFDNFTIRYPRSTSDLSSKDDRWLKCQHAARADNARCDHDDDHGRARAEQGQPGHVQSGQMRDVPRGDEEDSGHADAQSEADSPHEQCLEHDHPQDASIGDAHRLERAELFETFHDE